MIINTYVNPVSSFGFLSVSESFSRICLLLKIQTLHKGKHNHPPQKRFPERKVFENHRKPPLTEIFFI